MSEPLTNCHTCGWAAGLSCDLPWGSDNYIRVGNFVAQHCQTTDSMPPHDSTGCPGWKPRPAAIAAHDIPGHRPDDLTHARSGYCVVLEVGVWLADGKGDPGRTININNAQTYPTIAAAEEALAEARTHRPFRDARIFPTGDVPHSNTDRAQLASLGTKPSAEVTEASLRARIEATFVSMATTRIEPDTITIKRAAWDATLATIARLESRVESLEDRADEAERLARGVGPRVAAKFRRYRLRGGR